MVRLDRLQAGVCAALTAALPGVTVAWAMGYPSAEGAASIVTARVVSGPGADPLGAPRPRVRLLPMRVRVRVLPGVAAASGEDVRVRVSGLGWEHAIGPGATVQSVRDALLAAIGPAPMVSATFTANDTDEIDVEADALGDLYNVAATGTIAGLIETEVLESVAASVQFGEMATLLELQAYSQSPYPRTGASSVLSRFLTRCRLPSISRILDSYAVGMQGPLSAGPTNLDALSGSAWRSRAAVLIRFSQPFLAAEPAETIESASLGLAVRNPDGTSAGSGVVQS